MTMRRPHKSVAIQGTEIIQAAGGTINSVEKNKHTKVMWTLRGVKKITVFNTTASDGRSLKNDLALVRRQIRQVLGEGALA